MGFRSCRMRLAGSEDENFWSESCSMRSSLSGTGAVKFGRSLCKACHHDVAARLFRILAIIDFGRSAFHFVSTPRLEAALRSFEASLMNKRVKSQPSRKNSQQGTQDPFSGAQRISAAAQSAQQGHMWCVGPAAPQHCPSRHRSL